MMRYVYDPETKSFPGLDKNIEPDSMVTLRDVAWGVYEAMPDILPFMEKVGRITECFDRLDLIDRTLFDAEQFLEGIDDAIGVKGGEIAESRLTTHTVMLDKHKKIYIPTSAKNIDTWWHPIGDQPSTMEKAQGTLHQFDPETVLSRSWTDLLFGTQDIQTIFDFGYQESYMRHVVKQATVLNNAVPGHIRNMRLSLREGSPLIVPLPSSPARVYESTYEKEAVFELYINQCLKDEKTRGTLENRAQSLSDSLKTLLTEPEAVVAETITEAYLQKIKDLVAKFVDASIANAHSEYFQPQSAKQKREKRKQAYAELQAKIDGPSQLSHIDAHDGRQFSLPHVTRNDTLKTVENQTAALVDMGTTKLSFPWIGEEREYELKVLPTSERKVYVVTAEEPKILNVKKSVREGKSKNADGLDTFDQAILQRIKTLAGGIMPYQDPTIRKLRNTEDEMRDEYKKLVIWYTFDISPNAPRVYFTVKPAPKSLGEDVGETDLLMIVLAETDKAHQVDILSRFTTLSRKRIVNMGAGSI